MVVVCKTSKIPYKRSIETHRTLAKRLAAVNNMKTYITVKKLHSSLLILLVGLLAGCASVDTKKSDKSFREQEHDELAAAQGCTLFDQGLASWYGYELYGNKTANGEKFQPDGITAAHKTLPFGTNVLVFMDNKKGNPDGVMVRINDRGPFVKGRIIDLSLGSAKKLGMKDTKPVHIYRCS